MFFKALNTVRALKILGWNPPKRGSMYLSQELGPDGPRILKGSTTPFRGLQPAILHAAITRAFYVMNSCLTALAYIRKHS